MEMTKKNAEVRREFLNGATSGKANRMAIVEGPVSYRGETVVPEGYTALVGYEWAVYAVRSDTGKVTINYGWYDWAREKRQRASKPGQSTTERHMSNLKAAASASATVSDDRPQCGPEPGSAREIERSPRRGVLGR